MKKVALFVGLVGSVLSLSAQDQDDFLSEFEKFRKGAGEEFETFSQKIDKEFSDFLANSWETFHTNEEIDLDPKPKPQDIPVPPKEVIDEDLGDLESLVVSAPASYNSFEMPTKESSREFATQYFGVTSSFFGQQVAVKLDETIREVALGQLTNEAIAKGWERAVETDFEQTIFDLNRYREAFNVNDFGYYLLVESIMKKVSPDENKQKLLSWFYLLKSGYDVKLGMAGEKLVHMIPSSTRIYGKRYMELQGRIYYVMDNSSVEVTTYDKQYPMATKSFDFGISKPIAFIPQIKQRPVSFSYNNETLTFNFSYDQNAIDYYSAFPLVDYPLYIRSSMTGVAKESLIDNLHPMVKDMDAYTAVDFLLQLVQKGFPYKTDDEQFGREKFYFPEEILHYPFSDCEDRSAFFAYLVSELTDREVVALDYANHVATAVAFDEKLPGEYITSANGKYYVCDPTYIGAPIGKAMVDSREDKPGVIKINIEEKPVNEQIAEAIRKIEEKGNYIVYSKSDDDKTILFTRLNGKENTYALIILGADGQVLSLSSSTVSVNESHNTLLMAFDKSGKQLYKKGFREDEYFSGYGIFEKDDNLFVVLQLNNSAIFDPYTAMVKNDVATYNFGTELRAEIEKLTASNYEKAISGIFAFFNLMEFKGLEVEGDEIVKTIDQFDPSFKKTSPNIYKAIKNLRLIRNQEGIITLKTAENIQLSKLRIKNNAQFRLVKYDTGNTKVEILSGASVGVSIIQYDLNFIKLFKDNGDLLFDYDDDHSQARLNLKKDILY